MVMMSSITVFLFEGLNEIMSHRNVDEPSAVRRMHGMGRRITYHQVSILLMCHVGMKKKLVESSVQSSSRSASFKSINRVKDFLHIGM